MIAGCYKCSQNAMHPGQNFNTEGWVVLEDKTVYFCKKSVIIMKSVTLLFAKGQILSTDGQTSKYAIDDCTSEGGQTDTNLIKQKRGSFYSEIN